MNSLSDLTSQVGVAVACQALAVPRNSFYRSRQEPRLKMVPTAPPTPSPRALSEVEQSVVRETLNSPRFVDQTPRSVYATLLDEQKYLCSWRTMYRILEKHQEVRERRNQLWSWDITKLQGATTGQTHYSSLKTLTL